MAICLTGWHPTPLGNASLIHKQRTEFQLIHGADGKPAFVVVPYEDWVEIIARRLDAGQAVALDHARRYARPARLAPAPSSSPAAMSAGLDGLPPLVDVPTVPPVPDLLPDLEDVQIEGAKVLPEVEETLEDVKASLVHVDAASASVEPAPEPVSKIKQSMEDASSKVKKQLDEI
jgi:hypothetical protein